MNAGDGRPFAAVQGTGKNLPALSPELGGRTVQAATAYRLTGNTTSFAIDAPGPGVVVLTEVFYPDDFHVTVNGRRTGYFRVNHAFKGIVIEHGGRHEITFSYWPQHFTLALILAGAGAVLLVLAAGWLWQSQTAREA